ncbi:magnesium chelatase subunit D family protein [Micromonospora sp. PSH03]|uniref:magnesium chelatase subunit D family protein n=1 Tax=Micromonospora TaxID=1873 RepID=UPI001B37B086|nr:MULTISPECIES: magnesium chelatase subunit D family protein [Micromonospora]MBQ0993950.1 magnesium chelatase subunit D family protein [Micromonospora sp. H61]MCG5458039.1 magnesium chelatase subunit D family protein [Micromonospora salmantinae]
MTIYPFSAVLGMADMRLALLLNAVSPAIGGVLVRGEKGTAKSTAVRALAALLPPVRRVAGCRFGCDPAEPDPACPDGPHPADADAETRPARLVELPVGAAEDRVVGALDLEKAIGEGVRAFEPGLLAAAHRGVLYVDEVNLLHDHLVDLLLDAAAMGRSHVEREGVSVSHAARFLLVGTMNPEEGELRPQLLDRFGLTVEVGASRDPEIRVEVVRRRLAADADPVGFAARWADADAEIAGQVAAARRRLPGVRLPDAALRQIAEVCAAFDVDGMRADIVTARTALAHAAWHGRDRVTIDDVRVAARLALPHRRRRDPFDTPGLDEKRLDEALQRAQDAHPDDPDNAGPDDSGPQGGGPDGGGGPNGGGPNGGGPNEGGPSGGGPQGGDGVDHCEPGTAGHSAARNGAGPDGRTDGTDGWPPRQPGDRGDDDGWPQHQQGGDGRNSRPRGGRQSATGADDPTRGGESQPVAVPRGGLKARVLTAPGLGDGVPGRRSRARTGRGRTTGARVPAGRVGALHLPATIRAAAPHQAVRGRVTGPLRLRRDDLREAVREGREGNLVLFVVDASGSMGARQRMTTVKDAVLALLTDAYQRRDKVAVIAFRGAGARTLLPATSSVLAASTRLAELPTGGRTPLAEGLLAAVDLLRVERLRDPKRRPLVLIVTDGRATAGTRPLDRAAAAAAVLAATGAPCVVVDCESGPVRLHLAARLATQLNAPRTPLEALTHPHPRDLALPVAA